jgi:hypothetical protein
VMTLSSAMLSQSGPVGGISGTLAKDHSGGSSHSQTLQSFILHRGASSQSSHSEHKSILKWEKKGVSTTFFKSGKTISRLTSSISQKEQQHSGIVFPSNPMLAESVVGAVAMVSNMVCVCVCFCFCVVWGDENDDGDDDGDDEDSYSFLVSKVNLSEDDIGRSSLT